MELFARFSNLLILSVPDEGYSRNASCALNLISTFLFVYKCPFPFSQRRWRIRRAFLVFSGVRVTRFQDSRFFILINQCITMVQR